MTSRPNRSTHPLTRTLSVMLFTLVCACGDEADDAATAEAKSATTTVDGASDAAEVSGWFADTTGLETTVPLTVTEARPVVIDSAASGVMGAVSIPACVEIDTDEATYLEATLINCSGPGGRGRLSGTVRGELGFVTTPCGPAQCPTGVEWTLTADLTWSDGRSLAGDWTLTAPVVATTPRSLAGQLTVTRDDGVAVATETSATWVTDEAGCTTLDADSMLSGDSSGALTIEGLEVCPGACPAAGQVEYVGTRATLSWTYDGGSVVTVVNGDRTFPLPLRCGL